MPTYVFKCKECGHIFDEYQRITETKDTMKCPKCGKEATKQLQPFSFTFKGSCGTGRCGI